MSAAPSSPRKSWSLWLVVLLVALILAAFEQGWAKRQALKTEPGRGAGWIWAAQVDVGEQSRRPSPAAFYAWRDFDLQEVPPQATLEIVADETYQLYVNGQWIGADRYRPGAPASLYPVNGFLRPGRNRIAVELRSQRGVGGLLVSLRAERQDPAVLLRSDSEWRILHRFHAALFKPDQSLPVGEKPRVWGGYSTGRWRVAPAEARSLPIPSIAAQRVRNTSPKARWVDLTRQRQFFPRLGPFLVFDWQQTVSGHLTLFLAEAEQPGLLYCGLNYPNPDRDPVTLVVTPISGTQQWTSVEAMEFRYCLTVGLPIEAPPRVEPAEISNPSATEDLGGVWGLEPPLQPARQSIPPVWERVRKELREERAARKNQS